jgi:hypothetical protein
MAVTFAEARCPPQFGGHGGPLRGGWLGFAADEQHLSPEHVQSVNSS